MDGIAILDSFFQPSKAQSGKISRMSRASEIPKFNKSTVARKTHVPIAKVAESKFLAEYNARMRVQPALMPKR